MLFLRANRLLITTLAILTLWLLAFELWSHWVSRNPVDEPIRLARGVKVATDIRIPIREKYWLLLMFERANIPYEELKRLIGVSWDGPGKPIPKGVPIFVRWSFTQHGASSPAAYGEKESLGSSAWSKMHVGRDLDHVHLEPGRYRFEAEILRDVPELSHMHTRIVLRSPGPKNTSAWQITLAAVGGTANLLLGVPIAVVVALVLAYRAFTHRLKLTSNSSSSGREEA